jgi:hypothetical protein
MESFLEEDPARGKRRERRGTGHAPVDPSATPTANRTPPPNLMPQSARKHPNNFLNNPPTGRTGLPKSPLGPWGPISLVAERRPNGQTGQPEMSTDRCLEPHSSLIGFSGMCHRPDALLVQRMYLYPGYSMRGFSSTYGAPAPHPLDVTAGHHRCLNS